MRVARECQRHATFAGAHEGLGIVRQEEMHAVCHARAYQIDVSRAVLSGLSPVDSRDIQPRAVTFDGGAFVRHNIDAAFDRQAFEVRDGVVYDRGYSGDGLSRPWIGWFAGP